MSQTEWLPIETAPSYTEVLCWRADQGVFISQLTVPEEVIPGDELERMDPFPEDFKEWFNAAWGWQQGSERPTHWMPLPEGPDETSSLLLDREEAGGQIAENHSVHLSPSTNRPENLSTPVDCDLLLDDEGENLAVRCFLMQYGVAGLTVGAMKRHMNNCGFRYWPEWAAPQDGQHLTKAGAQDWLRLLFSLETA